MNELDMASMWMGACVMSVIATLALSIAFYAPGYMADSMMVAIFGVYSLFTLVMSWRNYDGPLYGEVSTDA